MRAGKSTFWGISLFLIAALGATFSHAQSPFETYLSGTANGCPGFGPYSQSAMNLISNTQRLIAALKEKESCQGLTTSLAAINSLRNQVKRFTEPKEEDAQLLELQATVEALTNFANTLPASSTSASTNSSTTTVDGPTTTTSTSTSTTNNAAESALRETILSTLMQKRSDLVLQTARRSIRGSFSEHAHSIAALPELQASIREVLEGLPAIEQCLATKPRVFMEIVGNVLPLVATLGSPAFGAVVASAQLTKDFAKYLSEHKYARTLTNLERFRNEAALNCMMEQLQFATCDAKDALKIIGWRQKSSDPHSGNYDEDWSGYNFLVFELPKITEWVQRIQIGQLPQRIEDAEFFEDTEVIEGFYRVAKAKVFSYIADTKRDAKSVTGDQAKVLGLDLLSKIVMEVSYSGQAKINVFTRVISGEELPFFLIDRSFAEFRLPGFQEQGLELIRHPDNRGKIPTNLVEIIERKFKVLISGEGMPNGGTDREMSRVLTQRRIDDARDLINEAVDIVPGERNHLTIFSYLKVWLQEFVDRSGDLVRMYSELNLPAPELQVQNFVVTAEETLHAVSNVAQIIKDFQSPPEDRISRISEALQVSRSRDHWLAERLPNLVNARLQYELHSQTDQEIRDILDVANQEIYLKVVQNDPENEEFYVGDLEESIRLHRSHAAIFWSFLGKEVKHQLRKSKSIKERNNTCLRLIMLPEAMSDRELVELCAATRIASGHYEAAPPEWKTKLELRFADFIKKPDSLSEPDFDELKSCAFRNYHRSNRLYRNLKSPSRRIAP